MKILKMFLPALFVFVVFVIPCFAGIEAGNISHPKCLYKGIVGEAVGEGYEGMYAVACVYRNRLRKGLPLGCTALKRTDLDSFVNRQGEKYKKMVEKIVRKVFIENSPDVTNGATHYENIRAFGCPYWAKKMRVTAKIGNHTFFAEK